jgi:Ca2+/Na+ antiporter
MKTTLNKFKSHIFVIIIGTVLTVLGISPFKFPEYSSQINLLALVLTLVVLLLYTYDTHRIAEQTIETRLRPVVLRSGFIHDWESIKFEREVNITGEPIEFSIMKNVAKDIQGHIILERKKFTLLFGNKISEIRGNLVRYEESWGWMKPDTVIYAVFDPMKFTVSNKDNCISITYKDIEGNSYFTREDKNFSQSSEKL